MKTKNNDVILFDSILSFSESYQGSITSHPVEDGSKINDHAITENVKLKIQGVVSDYNFFNPQKDAGNTKVPGYEYPRSYGSTIINPNGFPETTTGVTIPQDYAGTDDEGIISIKASMDVVKQRLIAIQRNREFVTILSYRLDGNTAVVDKFKDCIITDISFNTTPDSGYAIYPDITIEQVKLVKVKVMQAEADKIPDESEATKAAGTDGKGPQSPGSAKDGTTDEDKTRKHIKSKAEEEEDLKHLQNRCYEERLSLLQKGNLVRPLCMLQLGLQD